MWSMCCGGGWNVVVVQYKCEKQMKPHTGEEQGDLQGGRSHMAIIQESEETKTVTKSQCES